MHFWEQVFDWFTTSANWSGSQGIPQLFWTQLELSATVVATAGSTYRKPGARMLIMSDGSYLGLLSGGCLEADLKLHAGEVLDGGATRAVEYDMRGPDDVLFGIGAGCEGAMRVLLEPANRADREIGRAHV